MLQFHVERCCIESNVAHKVRRYIHLFIAPGGVINTKRSITPPKELASDVEGVIPASSPCGLRSKAGGRTGAFTAEGAEYAKSEKQDSFVLFVSFVVKQFCTPARVLVLHPFSLITHSKRQRACFGVRCGRSPAMEKDVAHRWRLCKSGES